ncbi:MAG TPA: potassium/proton antiporter [Burkholderiales bacterium]
MELANQIIFVGALLIVLSIVASAFSSRFGVPILLVFLLLGMLAGEDGPGGIRFDDFQLAYLVGTIALAVILFDGGMRTRAESFRVGLRPALVLSTAGVVITAVITGVFSAWVFELSWLQGLLIGSIVGSTDAAAVFALLHARGMELKQRVAATLEIESGSNDPMAVFLVLVLIELLVADHEGVSWAVAVDFMRQMGIGALTGVIAGRALVWLINRLTLETGLYPLLAMAGGVLTYGGTVLAGGSGFLAIYLAGLVLGNSPLQAMKNIHNVHDGLAWLSQITMFLMLGLLVTPSALVPVALPALLVSVILMVVARPVSVWLSLLAFRFPWREVTFVSWVGLRGAVPIILAVYPIVAGVEPGPVYFNVAFFVVLMSLVLQGWTIAPLARLLGLEVPPGAKPLQYVDLDIPGQFDHDLLGYQLEPDCMAVGRTPSQLPLPPQTEISAVIRGTDVVPLAQAGALRPGDYVYVLATPQCVEILNRMFGAPHAPERLEEHRFFGDFVLDGDAALDDVSALYGLAFEAARPGETLAQYLGRKFDGRPVVGDRVRLGAVELVVRAVGNGVVTAVGLKLHD